MGTKRYQPLPISDLSPMEKAMGYRIPAVRIAAKSAAVSILDHFQGGRAALDIVCDAAVMQLIVRLMEADADASDPNIDLDTRPWESKALIKEGYYSTISHGYRFIQAIPSDDGALMGHVYLIEHIIYLAKARLAKFFGEGVDTTMGDIYMDNLSEFVFQVQNRIRSYQEAV